MKIFLQALTLNWLEIRIQMNINELKKDLRNHIYEKGSSLNEYCIFETDQFQKDLQHTQSYHIPLLWPSSAQGKALMCIG